MRVLKEQVSLLEMKLESKSKILNEVLDREQNQYYPTKFTGCLTKMPEKNEEDYRIA